MLKVKARKSHLIKMKVGMGFKSIERYGRHNVEEDLCKWAPFRTQ